MGNSSQVGRVASHPMLCKEQIKPEDFDRTGQTVRITDGAVPSVSQLILQVNATLLKICFLSKCEGINDVFCITLRDNFNIYPRP